MTGAPASLRMLRFAEPLRMAEHGELGDVAAEEQRHRPVDDHAELPGGERQRELARRVGVNVVMYALTGNYKTDQVHIPALLERLGQ